MQWILIIAGVAMLAAGSVWLRFWPPPWAGTLIRFGKGKARVKKGQVRAHVREDVAEILRGAGVSSGFIAVMSGNRVVFSRSIGPEIHQRLRNVLLNQ